MFIGLDVHKATISVAVAKGAREGEVRHWGAIPHQADQIRKLSEKLSADGLRLHFCYEAGPCGYGLHRQLVGLGHDCIVVAPSLIPVKAGDRVKTDRRDAVMLAKLHRAGELTAVWVPDAAHEAMRDLVRARAHGAFQLGELREDALVLSFLLSRVFDLECSTLGWISTQNKFSRVVCAHLQA